MLTTTLLLLAAAASPAPQAETFEMTLGGNPYGTEEFLRVAGPEGTVLTGKVTLQIGETGAVLSQESKLAPDGHPIAYALDIEAPGQQFVLRAVPKDAAYALSLLPKGGGEPLKTADVEAKAPVFLLDNNFASHLDALTRALAGLGSAEERAL